MRNVITKQSLCVWERVFELSRAPQLAWHLAWHIAGPPRPLPVCPNVAVDKPIKKPLLNALPRFLSLSLSFSSTPCSTGPQGERRKHGRNHQTGVGDAMRVEGGNKQVWCMSKFNQAAPTHTQSSSLSDWWRSITSSTNNKAQTAPVSSSLVTSKPQTTRSKPPPPHQTSGEVFRKPDCVLCQ